MKIEKRFDLTVSKRFPNGDIASMHLGTTQSFECEDPNLEQEAHDNLSKRVYTATMRDIKKAIDQDPLAKSIWDSTIQALSQERKVKKAEKKYQDEEDES